MPPYSKSESNVSVETLQGQTLSPCVFVSESQRIIHCDSASVIHCICSSVLSSNTSIHIRMRRPIKPFDASLVLDECHEDNSLQQQPDEDEEEEQLLSSCHSKTCQAKTHKRQSSTSSISSRAAEHAEHLVKRVWEEAENAEKVMRKVFSEAWNVCHFTSLPNWLQDNDYLHTGHRPPLASFKACFMSAFRLHTETGNIWTHALGCLLFTILAIYYLLIYSPPQLQFTDKIVFGCFFACAIICLGLSTLYHTLSCHSHQVGKLFSKLDYCGISLLITGSFVPWLYYGFYCSLLPKVFYLCLTICLGICSVVVSFSERFSEPHFRPLRAGVFMSFGLSGVIPGAHWILYYGWTFWIESSLRSSITSLILMGFLYIAGAILYASRIPERFLPGKCDYWFHSHQLFHVLVICAAVVHYHGITCMADYRLNSPSVCEI